MKKDVFRYRRIIGANGVFLQFLVQQIHHSVHVARSRCGLSVLGQTCMQQGNMRPVSVDAVVTVHVLRLEDNLVFRQLASWPLYLHLWNLPSASMKAGAYRD